MLTAPRIVILFVMNFINYIHCDPFELSVLHINDFHGRFDEVTDSAGICKAGEKCIGGFSRLYKQIDNILKHKPNTIVVNAGDDFSGTLWYTIGKWNITQEFMNRIKFEASTLGNHEFDDGLDNLVQYLKHLKHPMLVSNLDASAQPDFAHFIQKSTVIKRNGRKIGIIGVMLSWKIFNVGKLKFQPESASVNKEAERLVREERVFTNIVLSHCGYEMDKIIAKNASEKISLIVGGHSHIFLYTGDNPPGPEDVEGPYPTIVISRYGHKIPIVHASSYSRYLGNITLYLDNHGEVTNWSGYPIFLDTSFPKDEVINQKLDLWRRRISAVPNPIIGNTLVQLRKWKCFKEECTLGNFATDAMIYAYTKHANKTAWTDASIAIADAESMRTNLEQGDITRNDLNTALPYENTLDVGEIEGSKLKEIFEYNTIREIDGKIHLRILQVSGIKIVYNFARPYGNMVQFIKLRCQNCSVPVYEELNPTKMYRMIVDSYLLRGGGNFTVLVKNFKNRQIGPVNRQIFEEYLARRSPIYEDCGTRIIMHNKQSYNSSGSSTKQSMVIFCVIAITFKMI